MSLSLGQAKCTKEFPSGLAISVTTEEHGVLSIPNSGVHDDSDVWKLRQEGDLIIKDWFAEKKGFL
jgi:hypothetical protein